VVTSCTCNSGYTGIDGDSCSTCSAGKFKPVIAPGAPSWFVTAAGSFDTVEQACRDGGGELATIHSLAEYNIAAGLCQGLYCYIGLVRDTAQKPWYWVSGDAFLYSKWDSNQSANTKTKTVIINSSAVWHDWNFGQDIFSGVCRIGCQYCPSDSSSPLASTLRTACQCNAGYTGEDGGTCSACLPGTFKTSTGSASCTSFATGKSSLATGSVENVCTCEAGSTGPDGAGACTLCGAGTYKELPGSEDCTLCGVGSNIAETGSTTNICTCNAGWTGPITGPCVQCVAGKYKSYTGSEACQHCIAGTYSINTGGSSIGSCIACAAGKSTLHLDVRTQEAQCVACVPGTYTANPDRNAVCTLCPLDTFSIVTGASSISTCSPCNSK